MKALPVLFTLWALMIAGFVAIEVRHFQKVDARKAAHCQPVQPT